MSASLTICAAAISVRLDSSKSRVLAVFRDFSFPAIGMCPTIISPPAASFHRIEVGRRRSADDLNSREAGQPGKNGPKTRRLSITPAAAPRRGIELRRSDGVDLVP